MTRLALLCLILCGCGGPGALTPEQVQGCNAGGGCTTYTHTSIARLLRFERDRAYRVGYDHGMGDVIEQLDHQGCMRGKI